MIRIAVLYPDLLGTYGDGGNAQVLECRARWRGLEVAVAQVLAGDEVPDADLYLLGGSVRATKSSATTSSRATDRPRLDSDSSTLRRSAPMSAGQLVKCSPKSSHGDGRLFLR